MAKNIWIRASIKGCTFTGGKMELQLSCGNYPATGETVHTEPIELKELPAMPCFVKGMLNSSQNALVRSNDSWGPLGRLSTRFELKQGVPVYRIVNDFSRDGDIECVTTRDEAEKLCLLAQAFPCCGFTLANIAEANGFDLERLTVRGLKTLEMAVHNRMQKHTICEDALHMDDRVKAMIIAGI